MDPAKKSQMRWGLGVILFFLLCFDAALLVAPGGAVNDLPFLFLVAFVNVFVVMMVAIARFYKVI